MNSDQPLSPQAAPEHGAPARSRRGEQRRQALLQAARQLFMEQGYEATSLQHIVKLAGGSLSTAYQLFGNKAGMFRAVVLAMAGQVQQQALSAELLALPPAQGLPLIAEQLLAFSVDPEILALRRQLIAESHAMPSLAAELHVWFEQHMHQPMQSYFRRWGDQCGFAVTDPEQLTSLFMQMCCSWHMHHLLLGVGDRPAPEVLAKLARAGVALCFASTRHEDQGESCN